MQQQRWYKESIPLQHQVIVDVGANVGALSQFFWEASAGTSRLISIEPLPENVALINQRIQKAGSPDWTLAACAVSRTDGATQMGVFRLPTGGVNGVIASATGAPVTVPTRRLSQLVPDATVVKIDIEGHEYAVLDEALPALTAVHTWALELHLVSGQPLERVLTQLASYGYQLFAAGRSHPGGKWESAPIPADLTWEQIPIAKRHADGSVFKMLHVLAQKAQKAQKG